MNLKSECKNNIIFTLNTYHLFEQFIVIIFIFALVFLLIYFTLDYIFNVFKNNA
jgi:uncharacterized membrane protein YukC